MTIVLAVVSTIAGALATLAVWLGYRETRRTATRKKNVDEIRGIVREEIKVFVDKQQELSNRTDNVVAQQSKQTQELHDLTDKMGRVLDRLAVMETKIEVFWKSVAMDAAKIIHSPDPRRASIDALLDSFMNGTIKQEEVVKLKNILVILRDWEPGVPSDFPVYPGEQVAAAILLRTMDHAIEGRKTSDN